MSAKGHRHTHCRNGHRYTPETTYVYGDGRRECRVCMKARVRRYRKSNLKNIREYQRIWHEGKRRAAGVGTDNNRWKNRKTPIREQVKTYPAAPIAAWLERSAVNVDNFRAWSLSHGVSDKLVRDVLSGRRATLSLDSIDKILTAHGEPWMLEELYPLGDEVAA